VASGVEVVGEVLRIAPVVDAQSGTMRVTLRLPSAAELRPGMLISARIVVDRRQNALLIPRRALELDALRPSLFRLRGAADGGAGNSVERRHPRLGIHSADVVEVLEGLADGEYVVVAGQAALRDGMAVRVVEWDGLAAQLRDAGRISEDATVGRAALEASATDAAVVGM